MKRARIKRNGPRTKKSGGHLFPVDAPLRRYVRAQSCFLLGALITHRFSLHDRMPVPQHPDPRALVHCCWGVVTPAHVGPHAAQGGGDAGRLLPLCEAAHRFYDEHRAVFYEVTGLSERDLQAEAAAVYVRYQAAVGAAAPGRPA